MAEPSVSLGLRTGTKARPWTDQEEEALLVAALAATLVEYRRSVGERNDHNGLNGPGTNWRIVARMEQLRGKA